MKNKNETDILNETIDLLQNKQVKGLESLTEQFYQTYESLKPINLIKSVLQEVSSSPEIKKNLIGLTIGYLSQKVIMNASHKLIRKNSGILIQIAVGIVVLKNSEIITSSITNLIQYIFKSKVEKVEVEEEEFIEDKFSEESISK